MKLSERLKRCTWLIKVSYKEKNDEFETDATGFALKVDKKTLLDPIEENDLVLMTCAHYIPKSKCSIAVRRFEDNCFLEARPLYMKTTWDTTLLVVKGANCDNIAEFADDGSISDCQTLLQVGHSEDLIWSIFVGRAAYPCVKDLVPPGPFKTCVNYQFDLKKTPSHRIMGHIWNQKYFDAHQSEKFPFEKNLDPSIPIIQCNGFMCRKGCSGGPVFNIQGQVVGMLVGEFDSCQTAIHVSLLKEFMKINSKPQNPSEVNKNVKQLTSGGEVS
jgi:hypothetical protein